MKYQNSKINCRRRTKFFIFNFCILNSRERGFGLIEIVVASAMASVALAAFGQVAQTSYRLLQSEQYGMEASFIIQEGFEGVRALRDAGWTANIAGLTNGTNYYLTGTTTWSLVTKQPAFINGRYDRTVVFTAVNRDCTTQQIVTSGGCADAGTKKVTATVSWQIRNATTSLSSVMYLTNFLQN